MWLLGIAANLMKRKQQEWRKHAQRKPIGPNLHNAEAANMTDDALFIPLAVLKVANPTDKLEAEEL
jgi:hypothetical protein